MSAGYFMYFSRDLINLADIEVTYRNADGQIVIDTITSNQTDTFQPHWKTVKMPPDSSGVEQPDVIEDDSTILVWPGVAMEFDSIPTRVSFSVRILPKPFNEDCKDNRYKLYLLYGLSVAEDSHDWHAWQNTLLDWVDVRGSNVGKAIDIANDNNTTLDFTTQRMGSNPNEVETVKTDQ